MKHTKHHRNVKQNKGESLNERESIDNRFIKMREDVQDKFRKGTQSNHHSRTSFTWGKPLDNGSPSKQQTENTVDNQQLNWAKTPQSLTKKYEKYVG